MISIEKDGLINYEILALSLYYIKCCLNSCIKCKVSSLDYLLWIEHLQTSNEGLFVVLSSYTFCINLFFFVWLYSERENMFAGVVCVLKFPHMKNAVCMFTENFVWRYVFALFPI